MSKFYKHYGMVFGLCMVLLGANITYPSDIQLSRINNNSYYSIFITIWILLLYFGLKSGLIKSLKKYDYFVGFIFSFLYCSTFAVNNGLGRTYISGGINVLFTLYSFISWCVVYTLTFAYIRENFGAKISINIKTPSLMNIWLILVLIWGISMFALLPGQISWDGLRQFCEFDQTHLSSLKFTYVPTNHHPWFTTLFFGSVFSIGRKLYGTNFGIFLIILIQFLISSTIYALVIKYVWHRVGKIGGVISFILFASPLFSSYVLTIDKSTLYYAFLAWFYLSFAKLFEKDYLKKNCSISWETFEYLISATLVSFFRNDAFLVVIISTIILIIFTIKEKTKLIAILCAFVVIFAIHIGWNSILTSKNVIKSSPSEALTLPIRQLSYVYMNDSKSLDDSELTTINKITKLSEIKSKYDINNGDYLKSLYPSDTFLNSADIISDVVTNRKTLKTTLKEKKETVNYLKVWIKEGVKHPAEYINVYLAANSRYLNPFILYDNSLFINYYPSMPFYMKPSWYSQYHPLFNENVRNFARNILLLITMFPPLAIIGNPGVIMWVALGLLFILIWQKNIKEIFFLVPVLIMCLLFTVTSINGYTRYTMGVLAVLPIVLAYLWEKINKYINKGEK